MSSARPKLGAFNQGATPTIACVNAAKMGLGVDFQKLVAALQAYVDRFIAPVWGTPAKLVISTKLTGQQWGLVFLDDADVANALAYHDLTPAGFPLSKVFVRTTLRAGEAVSVSASHELVEMLVDPAINLMTTGPDPRATYAYETADPCEALAFPVLGIPMSDFVYPSYFEAFRPAGSVRFDAMGKVRKPFEILRGGYQIVFKGGRWSQVFGSATKGKAFQREDRRGHRSEQRKRVGKRGLERSAGGAVAISRRSSRGLPSRCSQAR